MLILDNNNLDKFNFNKTAVALGSFEALHAGHMKIIKNTVKCAKENNLKSVITIFKSPVLKNRTSVCETLDERLSIIEKAGADTVVIFDFNEKFKALTYTEFFEKYLLKIFKAAYIFTGFNYHFGYQAKGNTENLSSLCKQNNIVLTIEEPVIISQIVSSTYIHELIKKGDVENLKKALLRPYSITGKVKKGREIGRQMGFPTANIDFPENKAIIKDGVYFGIAETKYGNFKSIINVGNQPTVTNTYTPRVEAYILNFENNLYDTLVKLNFLKKLRDIKKFSNIDELKCQLEADKKEAEQLIIDFKINI